MSKFAILRTDKLKHLASVRRSLKHSFREQPTPNADARRTAENTHIGAASVEEAMRLVAGKLPAQRRKDAVLAIEYLVTASPEAMHGKSRAEQDAYFDDALAWLRDRHGAENVVYAGIHRDERTPHMYAYVVPLDPDSGRLNCRRYLGGAKALNQLQTEFAAKVGQRHGLERGIEGSKATHQRVQSWYAQVARPLKQPALTAEDVQPRVTKKGTFRDTRETPGEVADRLNDSLRATWAPVAQRAKVATTERQKAAAMAKAARDTAEALKTAQEAARKAQDEANRARQAQRDTESTLAVYKDVFEHGLTASQKQRLVSQAKRDQAENRERAEAERLARMTPEQREREAREEAEFQRSLRQVEAEERQERRERRERDRGPSLG